MAQSAVRRPLPALAFLLGLLLLALLVWWRVIHRSDANASPKPSATCTTSTGSAPSSSVLPANASVSIQVLNSTQRAGLAGTVGAAMVQLGFKQAGLPANDLTSRAPVAGVAELRFGPTGKSAADLLMYYLPGSTEVPDQRTTAVVDVALGAKFTALATPAAVAAALQAAHVTQSGAVAPTPSAGKTTPTSTATKSTSSKSTSASSTASC